MAKLPCNFFAIFILLCFGKYMATYSDTKDYIYRLPGKMFGSFMQCCLESVSQHCQVIFRQSLCKVKWKSIWQCYQISILQALHKVILASIWQYCKMTFCQSLFKAAPKTKWQCCHATFLQSLFKSALASTWQPA